MNEQCPVPDVLAAFASGELTPESRSSVELHVSRCDTCLEAVGFLTSRSSRSESPGLSHPSFAEVEQMVGAYRLVRRIGEGGMGEVWEAQQTAPVRRNVALKLLKAGMDTRQVIARFEAERQMLALMQHPGIAQIYDAGITDAGRSYFVMEHVAGVRITSYCDSANLPVRERLELFKQVCEAVQHAHQKGVIHRDLKPSNVLVATHGGRPQPKVIDFGLGKATTNEAPDHSMTEMGTLLGTPAYASPEQMSLGVIDIDTRSDVYSLGALLYELLVGVIPFDVEGTQPLAVVELRRAIREREPTRPSARLSRLGERVSIIAQCRGVEVQALRKQLRGDLDWIVMKALEKERDRRYTSPHELALDIDRYLNHEPLQARPPTPGYRFRKFVRRHQLGTAFAGVLALLIVSFVVVTVVQAQRIAEERDRATAEATKATSINAFLQETMGSADPWQTGKDVSIREVLADAAIRATTDFKDQPLIAVAVKNTIGKSYVGLGQLDAGEVLLQEGLEVSRTLLGDEHPDVAANLFDLANAANLRQNFPRAVELSREALEIRRKHFGDAADETANSLIQYAAQLVNNGEPKAAEAAIAEALSTVERTVGSQSVHLIEPLSVSATVATKLGDFASAERALLRAVKLSREHYGNSHPKTAVMLNNLGQLYYEVKRYEETKPLCEEALDIQTRQLGADHPETLITMENLAGTYVAYKRFDDARRLLEAVLEGRKAKLGESALPVVRTMANLANFHVMVGDLDRAVELYEIVLPRYESVIGSEHPENVFLVAVFARTLRLQGDLHRAETLLTAELNRQPSRLAGDAANLPTLQFYLGAVLLARGAYADAETQLLAALKARQQLFGPRHRYTEMIGDDLAKLYTVWGKPAEAAKYARGAQ